ncbi:MAG: ATP-binding cassette domain-containing protein [Cyclobacteriaceae bacterium]|nr:ATP-binding cassette domain-containing protein [Cyclobacteriaceae bacterium]
MKELLSLSNATYFRLGKQVFKNLNWQLYEGESWVLLGNTGSGKTSLMQALCGSLSLKAGTAAYHFLSPEVPRWQLPHHIHLVTFTNRLVDGPSHYYQQRFNISSKEDHTLTVRDYLQPADTESNYFRILKLAELLDKELIMLSNGQTRRVILAKALAATPALLLLDNPFAGLDLETRKALRSFIDALIHSGQRIILTCTHATDIPTAFTHALVLQDCEIIFSGKRTDIPGMNNASAPFIPDFEKPRADFTIAVELQNVTVAYSEKKILDKVSWTVRAGEKWALQGPNGSGKSTLLSLINADNPQAYANEIILFDQPKSSASIWQIKKRIGYYSPELQAYFTETLTVREVLLTGFTDTWLVPKTVSAEQRNRVHNLLTWFNKQDLLPRVYAHLSSGEQRLVLLLRALVKNAELLILDEPFQGLDAILIEQCKKLIDTLSNTLIFVSHYADEIPECITQTFHLNTPPD